MRRALLWLAGVVLAALAASPLVYLAAGAGEGAGVGALLARGSTWSAIARTVGLGAAVGVGCVALSLPLAWLTHASDLPGRRFFRLALVLPLAVPSYVGGFVVVATFAPGGFWPVLDPYGPAGAMLALSFTYPLAYLSIQAALDRLDPRLWEAARSLGLAPRRAFARVVMPALRPAMASGGLLVALYSVGDFGAVSLTRFESLSYLVYLRHKSLFARDEAAALAVILVVIAALMAAAAAWVGGRRHRELRSQARAWPVVPLGRWRWPAALLCAAVVGAGVVVPVAVVAGWWARGVSLGNAVPVPWRQLASSVWIAAAAALLLVALGLVPAALSRFGGRRAGAFTSLVVQLGYALPGIVVALAVIYLATRHAFFLYQGFALLLLAYAVRFLPLATGALDDGLGSQSPSLFWAARSLGCTPVAALGRAVLPAARSAVAVAALAVFIAVLKELPVTLLVAPLEFSTLATRIWALTEDAYFAEAAAPVLLLLVVAAAALVLRPDIRRRAE